MNMEEKYIFRQRPDNPSKKGFISYDHMIDAQKYQLEKETHNITAPTLIITGDSDISSTIEINQTLFDSLSSKKELHIINYFFKIFATKFLFFRLKYSGFIIIIIGVFYASYINGSISFSL